MQRVPLCIMCFIFLHSQQLVSMKFIRKYIAVAKDVKPVLTREAADYLADEYAKLRNQDNMSANNVAKVRDRVCLQRDVL